MSGHEIRNQCKKRESPGLVLTGSEQNKYITNPSNLCRLRSVGVTINLLRMVSRHFIISRARSTHFDIPNVTNFLLIDWSLFVIRNKAFLFHRTGF